MPVRPESHNGPGTWRQILDVPRPVGRRISAEAGTFTALQRSSSMRATATLELYRLGMLGPAAASRGAAARPVSRPIEVGTREKVDGWPETARLSTCRARFKPTIPNDCGKGRIGQKHLDLVEPRSSLPPHARSSRPHPAGAYGRIGCFASRRTA